jgi:ABC-type phosphate transport system substrate-binding protein
LVVLLALASVGWTSMPAAHAPGFVVVVNTSNSVTTVSLSDLQRIFRKQTRMWPNGETVVPVDWDATSEIRQEFSKRVLNRSVREMGEYWVQQSITQGLAPPTSLKSARAILRFVASVPGAIGYLPAVDLDGTVRRIEVKGL